MSFGDELFQQDFAALYDSVATLMLLGDTAAASGKVISFFLLQKMTFLEMHHLTVWVLEQAEAEGGVESSDPGWAFLGALETLRHSSKIVSGLTFDSPGQALDFLVEVDAQAWAVCPGYMAPDCVSDDLDAWRVKLAVLWNALVEERWVRGPDWAVRMSQHAYWVNQPDWLLRPMDLLLRDRKGWGGEPTDVFMVHEQAQGSDPACGGWTVTEALDKFESLYGPPAEWRRTVVVAKYTVPRVLASCLAGHGSYDVQVFSSDSEASDELLPYRRPPHKEVVRVIEPEEEP